MRRLVSQSSVVFAKGYIHINTHTQWHTSLSESVKVLLQLTSPPSPLVYGALAAPYFFIMRNKRVKVWKAVQSCAKPLRTLGNLWKICESNCALLFHPSSQLFRYFFFSFSIALFVLSATIATELWNYFVKFPKTRIAMMVLNLSVGGGAEGIGAEGAISESLLCSLRVFCIGLFACNLNVDELSAH